MPETCENVRLAHFNLFRAPETGAARWISNLKDAIPSFLDAVPGVRATKDFAEQIALSLFLTSGEMQGLRRRKEFVEGGMGYIAIQGTKVRHLHRDRL